MRESIPKVIHYCWFGGNPLSELAVKCIESWKTFCPGYEIKEWNEDNYNVRACKYISEAYDAKKWAFVSDYARFDIIYNYGGIYFDTDVELIAPIDDILQRGSFMGMQACCRDIGKNEVCLVNPGLGLAGSSGNEIFMSMLNLYRQARFYNGDGSMNKTTVVSYTTRILKEYGLNENIFEIQNVNGIYIYPPEYFCPKNPKTREMHITRNTRSIHHFEASWKSEIELKAIEIAIKYQHFIPINVMKFLVMIRCGECRAALKKAGESLKRLSEMK